MIMESSKNQGAQPKTWETYEEVAADLLNRFREEFGLKSVEGKQKIHGRESGTDWEIDAKGIREGDEALIIVECRRYEKDKQNQGKAGSLAYTIIDTGAAGGIFVSPLGFQEGAAKIAAARNILDVRLNPNSTPTDFALQFLEKLFLGVSAKAEVKASATPRLRNGREV